MSTNKGNWWDTEYCTRCSQAKARAIFVLKSGGMIYACGHHANAWSKTPQMEALIEESYYAPALKEENRAVGAVH